MKKIEPTEAPSVVQVENIVPLGNWVLLRASPSGQTIPVQVPDPNDPRMGRLVRVAIPILIVQAVGPDVKVLKKGQQVLGTLPDSRVLNPIYYQREHKSEQVNYFLCLESEIGSLVVKGVLNT